MKLLHFADAHIDMANYGKHDPETGLPLRVLDFLKALDTIVDAAISEKVDMVIFAGDAYKDRSPAPTFQREWGKRIIRLSRAKIPTLLLVGNHDLSPATGRAHAIQEFDTLEVPYVRVLQKPQFYKPADLWDVPVQVIAMPWVSRSGWRPPPAVPATGASLPEQRRLASGLRRQLEGRTVSILGPSDQRVLTDRLDAGRLVVWTPATYRYYRSGAGESSEETLARLLLEGSPELVVCDLGYDLERATGGRFRVARDHVVQERGVTLFAPYLPVPP